MIQPKMVTQIDEVEARLLEFGVTRSDIRQVALAALAARNESVAFDPKTAKGLLAYVYGVRALREAFVHKAGYEPVSRQNIESVYDEKAGRKIMFQTVESACNPIIAPQAINDIGFAKQAVIQRAQLSLFPEINEQIERDAALLSAYERAEAWYLCVAFNDDAVFCELSRPVGVDDKKFAGFAERIFIIDSNDPAGSLMDLSDDAPPIDFTPVIIKR